MDKKTLSPIMTVVGVLVATSLFLVLINIFSGDSSLPEQDASPPPPQPQARQATKTPQDVLPEEPPQENEPDIAQLVRELASPLRYVKIIPGAPRLEEDTEAADSYTVTVAAHPPGIKDLFGMHEYTFETGNDFSDMTALCRALTEVPRPATAERAKSQVVFEELYAISGLIHLSQKQAAGLDDKVAIYVRGYADGQTADWVRPLLEKRYAYHAIDVHPPLASDSQQPAVFLQRSVTIEIPNTYNNHTLPDLRAQFITDAILRPFLRECVGKQIPVTILKGHTFASPDKPLQRRVDVYVSFY